METLRNKNPSRPEPFPRSYEINAGLLEHLSDSKSGDRFQYDWAYNTNTTAIGPGHQNSARAVVVRPSSNTALSPGPRETSVVLTEDCPKIPNYCEAYFRELVERNPDELISLIESGELEETDLTFAAEILGSAPDSDRVVPVLVGLLDHPSALVREGAVYGLGEHESHMTREVREKLGQLARNDPNAEIREIAGEALES